mgnify:CR=1 FL=1
MFELNSKKQKRDTNCVVNDVTIGTLQCDAYSGMFWDALCHGLFSNVCIVSHIIHCPRFLLHYQSGLFSINSLTLLALILFLEELLEWVIGG